MKTIKFELENKVWTRVEDHSNNRGMGPDYIKVYGYVCKINKVTCDVRLVNSDKILRRNFDQVHLYVNPFE
jgi:hypothetical protein